jgi:hypothetical protein
MQLENDEYRIDGDGIWISKAALEECKQHYCKVADKCHLGKNNLQKVFYTGKADVYMDWLKHFELLEP